MLPQPQRIIPLERFRAILGHLDIDHQSFSDAFWMRFAAQAAVYHPEEPPVVAERLRQIADNLHHHVGWFATAGSPMRYVIAALLLKTNTAMHTFAAEYHRIGDVLDKVGLRHGGRYEPLTVLILHTAPGHDSFSLLEAERLKAIYRRMKSFHWWLTGIDDLPACAALAQIPETADVIAATTKAIYQRLAATGCLKGNHLQTASNLLPLTGLNPDDACERWLGLMHAMSAAHAELRPVHYDVLSVLSLLVQPAPLIVERMLATRREIDLSNPDLVGDSSLMLAADLTALDLVRCDSDGSYLSAADGMAVMLHRMHTLTLATMVQVSQVEIDLGTGVGINPPLAWPYL
ncbi:MAG TPA: DUF4003 family protein [Planctomycetota bacterium]|nr:DUF4003 family protein [Planctomycetota bacterium]